MWINEVYELNKKLDEEFILKYQANEKMEDNFLSLLVEIGELANETRCFKYWSKKGPSKKEVILEEYADVFVMMLCFCNYLKVEGKDFETLKSDRKFRTIQTQFVELYQAVCDFNENYNKEYILFLLSKVLVLGHSLGFSEEEMQEGIVWKMNIVEERLNSDY